MKVIKHCWKKIEQDARWKDLPFSWFSRITIVKMAVLAKLIRDLNNLIILPVAFRELEKTILNFIWKHKRLQITKEILKRKRNPGGSIIPDIKL